MNGQPAAQSGPTLEGLLQQAQFLIDGERYSDAGAVLSRALAINPENGRSHAMLAICHGHQSHRQAALDAIQRALKYASNDAWNHYIVASAYLLINDEARGRKHFETALRLDPNDPDILVMVARFRAYDRNIKQARSLVERALRVDPENVEARSILASLARFEGDVEGAASQLSSALGLAPNDAESHVNFGWLRLHQGDQLGAEEGFREALRISPKLEPARTGLLLAIANRNRFARLAHKCYFRFGTPMVVGIFQLHLILCLGLVVIWPLAHTTGEGAWWYLATLVAAMLTASAGFAFTPLLRGVALLDPFAWRVATLRERIVSVGLWLFLAAAFATIILFAVTQSTTGLLFASSVGGCTTLLLTGALPRKTRFGRWTQTGMSIGLAAMTVLWASISLLSLDQDAVNDRPNVFVMAWLLLPAVLPVTMVAFVVLASHIDRYARVRDAKSAAQAT